MSDQVHVSEPVGFDRAVLRHAEQICRRELSSDDQDAQLLYLRGHLASRSGQREFALECLTRAVSLGASSPDLFTAFAEALGRCGRPAEAVAAHLRAVMLGPDDAKRLRQLARALVKADALAAARGAYELALALEPAHAATVVAIAELFLAASRLSEAEAQFREALTLAPDLTDAYNGLGKTLLARREPAKALDCFRQGLTVARRRADLHIGSGQALLALGHTEDAVAAFRASIAYGPSVEAWRLLICALELVGRPREAGDAWRGLGTALEQAGEYGDAIVALQQAVRRKPQCLSALRRLGWCYLSADRPREAMHCFEAALPLSPDLGWLHIGLGQACHLTGDLERGWSELEWYEHDDTKRRFEQPVWDGAPLPDGQTLLVWTEQGLGDAIQLFRYLTPIAAQGTKVIVECDPILMPLAATIPGVASVIPSGGALPDFDMQATVGALPRILRTSRDSIPTHVPYLEVEASLRHAWHARLPSRSPEQKRVGLVWSGEPSRDNARTRFTTLSSFAALARVQNVQFICLQLGAPVDELLAPPSGLRIEKLLPDECGIDDTAALISNLDLIITVDTMVAHLAGALAKSVWTVVPFATDWRWHRQGDRTPWYPTMRLFRQPSMGDWRGVMDEVSDALRIWVSGQPSPVGESAACTSDIIPAASHQVR